MSMMTTKATVKTWLDQDQKDTAMQPKQTQLTEQQKQALGAENIGDVLNKVSDANWVDPSKQVRGTGNNKMDKEAFFKLMLTQLKNQDPTNPLKNHEMAAQLAQFSSLEQMSNMNQTLEEMKNGNKPVEQFQALNLIGKQVAGDAARMTRTETDKEHEFKFSLPHDAKTSDIRVINQRGEVVREFKFKLLKAGENKITWNGMTDDGRKAPAGDYRFEIDAVGSNDRKLAVKTDFEGVVSGMSFSNEGPVLQVGKQSIRLKDIRQFSDPSLKSNDQKSTDITSLDLKMSTSVGENKVKEEEKTAAQKQAMSGSIDNVLTNTGMSSELMGKIRDELDQAQKQKDSETEQGGTF